MPASSSKTGSASQARHHRSLLRAPNCAALVTQGARQWRHAARRPHLAALVRGKVHVRARWPLGCVGVLFTGAGQASLLGMLEAGHARTRRAHRSLLPRTAHARRAAVVRGAHGRTLSFLAGFSALALVARFSGVCKRVEGVRGLCLSGPSMRRLRGASPSSARQARPAGSFAPAQMRGANGWPAAPSPAHSRGPRWQRRLARLRRRPCGARSSAPPHLFGLGLLGLLLLSLGHGAAAWSGALGLGGHGPRGRGSGVRRRRVRAQRHRSVAALLSAPLPWHAAQAGPSQRH